MTTTTIGQSVSARGWFNPWTFATLVLVVIFLGPIVAVFVAATGDSGGLWDHLFETVLPRYVVNTLVLMAGVGAVIGWIDPTLAFFIAPFFGIAWVLGAQVAAMARRDGDRAPRGCIFCKSSLRSIWPVRSAIRPISMAARSANSRLSDSR